MNLNKTVGQSFRPCNGEEGEIFQAKFCYKCRQWDDADYCPINHAAWWSEIGEPEYPAEWIYNSDGVPVCTAFDPRDYPDAWRAMEK